MIALGSSDAAKAGKLIFEAQTKEASAVAKRTDLRMGVALLNCVDRKKRPN
jgi:hypothetical protein